MMKPTSELHDTNPLSSIAPVSPVVGLESQLSLPPTFLDKFFLRFSI